MTLLYLAALRTREFAESRLTALVQSELGSALGEQPFTNLVPADAQDSGLSALEQRVHQACKRVAHLRRFWRHDRHTVHLIGVQRSQKVGDLVRIGLVDVLNLGVNHLGGKGQIGLGHAVDQAG